MKTPSNKTFFIFTFLVCLSIFSIMVYIYFFDSPQKQIDFQEALSSSQIKGDRDFFSMQDIEWSFGQKDHSSYQGYFQADSASFSPLKLSGITFLNYGQLSVKQCDIKFYSFGKNPNPFIGFKKYCSNFLESFNLNDNKNLLHERSQDDILLGKKKIPVYILIQPLSLIMFHDEEISLKVQADKAQIDLQSSKCTLSSDIRLELNRHVLKTDKMKIYLKKRLVYLPENFQLYKDNKQSLGHNQTFAIRQTSLKPTDNVPNPSMSAFESFHALFRSQLQESFHDPELLMFCQLFLNPYQTSNELSKGEAFNSFKKEFID